VPGVAQQICNVPWQSHLHKWIQHIGKCRVGLLHTSTRVMTDSVGCPLWKANNPVILHDQPEEPW